MKAWIITLIVSLALASSTTAFAGELRISKQYGINYLPLIVLEEQGLIEKRAKEAGLGDVKVTWVTLGGGAAANEALLSGSVDFIALGVPPFVRLWDKTNGKAKGLAAFAEFPPVLNTSNPNVKTFRDFTEKDRIALPAAKVSLQSLILQIAVAKEFGIEKYDKLDHLTVTARHPDALIALTSGKSEITGHFTQEPFAYAELQHPGIRTVLDAYDVLGGKFTSQILAGTTAFYEQNPKLSAVVAAALDEAITWINANKEEAAKLYITSSKSKEPVEVLVAILNDPRAGFTSTPRKTAVFSDFLYETKAIKTKPASWKDLFFPLAHNAGGS